VKSKNTINQWASSKDTQDHWPSTYALKYLHVNSFDHYFQEIVLKH